MRAAFLVIIVLTLIGCAYKPHTDIHQALGEAGFEILHPPQSGWVVGSIVETSKSGSSVVVRTTPKSADIVIEDKYLLPSEVPDYVTSHVRKWDIDTGVSIPAPLRPDLKSRGSALYSVAAHGNRIERVLIDAFHTQVFPAMEKKFGRTWVDSAKQGILGYMCEIWLSTPSQGWALSSMTRANRFASDTRCGRFLRRSLWAE